MSDFRSRSGLSQRRCQNSRAPKMPKRVCRVRPLFTRQNSNLSRRYEEGRHQAPTAVTLAIESQLTVEVAARLFCGPALFQHLTPRCGLDAGAPVGCARRPGIESRDRDSQSRFAVLAADCCRCPGRGRRRGHGLLTRHPDADAVVDSGTARRAPTVPLAPVHGHCPLSRSPVTVPGSVPCTPQNPSVK